MLKTRFPSQVQQLCARHAVPCVVICGSNESGQTENVYDLVSAFPVEQCMAEALTCVKSVLENNLHRFPVLRDLDPSPKH